MRNSILPCILTLALGIALAHPALGCTDACPGFDPDALSRDIQCKITVKQSGDTEVEVTIDGFVTHIAQRNQGCGAAIGPWRSASIQSVAFIDAAGDRFPGFVFDPSPATADSISCVIGNGAEGFGGQTTAEIPTGQPVSLRIVAELGVDQTLEDLLDDLKTGFVAVGSTHPDGWFDGKHLAVVSTDVVTESLQVSIAKTVWGPR